MATETRTRVSGEPLRWSVGASAHHREAIIDGVRIAYDDEGSGPVIVGMHATAHGSRDFENVRAQIASSHRLITLDWPSHGRSGDDTHAFTAERCEALLAGFLDALQIDRALLIGCSIGGAAALRYAAAQPERVMGVVACNPGGLASIGFVSRSFCAAMAGLARAGGRNSWWFRPSFSLFCKRILLTPAARAQRDRIIAQGHECAPALEQAWRSFMEPSGDIRESVATISRPVLFAWAMQDAVVSFADSKAAVARVPDHKVVGFRGGHCAFLESPQEFLAALEDFETRISGA